MGQVHIRTDDYEYYFVDWYDKRGLWRGTARFESKKKAKKYAKAMREKKNAGKR